MFRTHTMNRRSVYARALCFLFDSIYIGLVYDTCLFSQQDSQAAETDQLFFLFQVVNHLINFITQIRYNLPLSAANGRSQTLNATFISNGTVKARLTSAALLQYVSFRFCGRDQSHGESWMTGTLIIIIVTRVSYLGWGDGTPTVRNG